MLKNLNPFFYKSKSSQTGYVMLFAIVLLAIFLAASASLLGYTTLNVRSARISYERDQALYLAEAGIDKAIYELNQDPSYTGETNTSFGSGAFTVTVSTISAGKKRFTSTGFVPNSTNPSATKTIKADAVIDTTHIAFNYGVQIGTGGLLMDNNSIIDGNVFSNGNITGGNGDITGDAIIAQGTSASPDEQWTVQNQDFQFGHTSLIRDVAQSFKPGTSNTLNKVEVYIKKVGTPGDITVRLISDNSGSPSQTVLASAAINASLVTASYGWIQAAFNTPPNLTSNTIYWLMLSPASSNVNNYYYWGSDSNNGYGNGLGKYSNNWNIGSPTWINIAGDLNYKTYLGGVITYFDAGIDVGSDLRATEIRDCGLVSGTAYYNTVFTNCSGASSGGNVPPGPQALPISEAQIADWKQTAEDGGVISGSYAVNGTESMGPKKINGDLTITNGSTLELTGPIWVKGNITFDNVATLRIAASLGDSGSVILADNPDNPSNSGIIDVSNGAIIEGNGNPSSFPLLLTTSTNDAAAIFVKNTSSAAIYYAPFGTITVNQIAGANQLTGNKIYLQENAIITYLTGLANSNFTNGPGASWQFLPGSFVISP